jgi:hypothetical protein
MAQYLTRAETAEFLRAHGVRYTVGSLKVLACKGRGPAYRLIGHRAAYDVRDLERFVRAATKPYVVTPAQSLKNAARSTGRSSTVSAAP